MIVGIDIPEGYEIDLKKSTATNIVLKKKEEKTQWRYNPYSIFDGYYIDIQSNILRKPACGNDHSNHNVFATRDQALSALAMARISQIIANDNRFGGPITDEEWANDRINKFVIIRSPYGNIMTEQAFTSYYFLAFHTKKQRDLFLKENEDLIKDYFMITNYE